MSSIITLIETIVADLSPDAEFVFGLKGWLNLKADDKNFPCVLLVEPISSTDIARQGGLYESTYSIFMIFLDKTQLRDTPQQQRAVVDAMRTLQRQFILRMKAALVTGTNEHIFKDISDIRVDDTFNELDVNASGVALTFRCTPLNSDSICVS